MKKKLINFLFFVVLSIPAFAQLEGYNYYSNLDTVKTSGFYNIVLSPYINAHLKTDYSDVRIIDRANKWVPHVFHAPLNEVSREPEIINLKFTIQASNKINTVVIIDATQQLNNINVLIKNTEVNKFGSLSGSDDKQNWFVVSDSILLTPQPSEKTTESNLKIKFPESNYKYLKLGINNRKKDPFDIISIAHNTTAIGFLFTNFSDSVLKNPATVLLQKDSGKISYIKIIQQNSFHFNEFTLKVSGLKYYNRQVDLYVAESNNNSFSNPGKFVQSFSISNNLSLRFRLPLINASTFYLLIKNEDNPALQIKEINTGLSYRYITAYLQKDNFYKLIMNNANASLPNYDITKDYPSIKDSVSVLSIGNIFAYENKNKIKKSTENSTQWIIWVAIIITLGLLLFFTKTMLKEVNKKNSNDNL